MGTNSYITKLKAQLDQAIIQREHWKQLAENRNSILVTEVCPESRSVEEYIVDADSVRASWRLIRSYREQAEALRVALHEIASVNPAQRGIEWAKSYASDGLKGAGSELYARWLETFNEAEALRAENEQLRERIAALEAENARLLAANLDCVAHFEQMRAKLAAIQGGMGEANKHGAQPEVAENTGSLNTEQTPIGVETVCLSVDGVAAPDEAELADDTRQARAAQPAPVVPECFRVLLKHAHGMTMGVDWNKGAHAGVHRAPLGKAVVQCQAWLAAAPAQGQQVEPDAFQIARHSKRLVEQQRERIASLEAELFALKAQQVGQEPQRCQCCGYLVTESEHRGCLRAAAPQPAPSQDVAGLASSDPVAKAEFETRLRKEFESRWPKPKGVTWGAGINDYCVSEFAEGIALSYPDMWMAYKAGAMRTNQ